MRRSVPSAEGCGEPSLVLGRRHARTCMMRRCFQRWHWEWVLGVRSGTVGAVERAWPRPHSGWRTEGGQEGFSGGEPPRLGNSSGVSAREALRRAEWKSVQFLHRGYCKRAVSLEETVRSSSLDVLVLRFLWDFSVHSFLPQAISHPGCV